MRVRTIDQDFEYQMGQCLKQFIDDFELEPENGEELFKEIWENRKEFGAIVYNCMIEWTDEDDWMGGLEDG